MPVENSPAPSSPDAVLPPRRTPTSRACDRCRRRKAKCEVSGLAASCFNCRESGEQCRFDMPLARRGPKRKRPVISNSALFPGNGAGPPQTPTAAELALSASTPAILWENAGSMESLSVDPALSPQTVHSSASEPTASARARGRSALQRWDNLSRNLAVQSMSLERVVLRCLDLFFEYLYPLTPLVHEPSLREAVSYFVTQTAATPSFSPSSNPATTSSATVGLSETWPEASFTLITAVCAEASFLLPKDLFPEGESVSEALLQASRDCLNHYLEADLENPNANSITIRYFHSNCLHAAGKPKYSWHIFGEATRLAQVMQLNEESSLEGLFPLEAELRRRAFWICFMGDKSASILNNRPITIHKFSFETGITTAYPTGIESEARLPNDIDGSGNLPEASQSPFIAGFNANLRLWQTASDLLLEMRLLQDQEQDITVAHPRVLSAEARNRLDALYVHFVTCLDDLPAYLQSYTFAAIAGGARETTERKQFIIQCANLQVSYHCLRMVMTQKFEDLSYFAPGFEQADLRKTEIARDMLSVLKEVSFWVMQVNGEPYVEKIRLIGASLLAIIHRNRSSPLAARARSDFSILLDILTRLDSKASDTLRNHSSWVV